VRDMQGDEITQVGVEAGSCTQARVAARGSNFSFSGLGWKQSRQVGPCATQSVRPNGARVIEQDPSLLFPPIDEATFYGEFRPPPDNPLQLCEAVGSEPRCPAARFRDDFDFSVSMIAGDPDPVSYFDEPD